VSFVACRMPSVPLDRRQVTISNLIREAMEDLMRSLLCALFVGLLICGGAAEAAKTSSQKMSQQTPPSSMKCPGDSVVWVNTRSHVYHLEGDPYFGSTKHGKFMCEHAADKAGYRKTKSSH
jgi:hypothetical protein